MNSKKLVTTATLAAAALAGISVSTNVQADQRLTNSVNTQQNAQPTYQAQVNQAQQRVTRAQVNLNSASAAYGAAQSTANGAQAALTSAQNSASAQQAAVSGAQAKADAASATVDSAQQVLQASQQNKPTSAAMTQTRQDIASQGDQLQSDQTALDAAKAVASESGRKTSAAQDQVNALAGQRNAQQATVNSAQTERDHASAALSDSNKRVADTSDALDTANSNVATAQAGVSSAQAALTSAQSAAAVASQATSVANDAAQTAQSAAATAQQAQQDATDRVNAASAKLASDSAALSAASQAVTAASAAVDQARYAQENLLPTFSFTAEQKALTQQLAREAKAVDDQVIPLGGWLGDSAITGAPAFNEWATKMTDTTLEAYQAGDYENYLERLKPYYGDWTDQLKSDKNETVDLTNVTDAQVHELSTFTAALLNRISQELGIDNIVSKEVATQGAAAVAKEVAQISTRDNVFGGHYLRALHTAYYDHGLTNSPADEPRYQTADSNDMGESLSTYGDSEISGPKMSMAKVKENLVQSIAGMIFADGGSQMGHAISMLGLDTIDNPNNEQIIGVAPSYAGMPNSWNTNVISMHINQPYLSCFKNPTAEQKQKQDAAGMFVELPDQTANAAREELKQA